ncbi:urease accessory protein UreF [Heyndrickxia ginsengihumi]|jgi:urease accessory protein|uniref:Urease accessory protein UreF n=1 Tax=Heyndrickxia ginsengihumi TaxID=363870 RepID=A0A0A6VCS1_9BACI|nr:urease accessory protein UreF [Heyndrickxia ginsengihumi]KHD84309.1 urease accessory protein UreF [Heyndrickxia ginsengihumi]MBE6184441.1 urease accessory protein UreF [Bacillus sp. (in: firmicutes)]MCM3024719.1 urease accessory protein UreF [Heyndrickxia ginsengihumi]NEY19794.1 urease accessory protein UreF [Heyndrickxia ginsengihumi]
MTLNLFPLLQLCDSNFPSGSFSHSFGFETYIQEHVIYDSNSFKQALITYLKKQLVYTEGLACKLAFELAEIQDHADWIELDQLLFSSCLAKETRLANKRIGERMLKLCAQLYPSEQLLAYLNQLQNKQVHGHAAIVFAIVAHHLEVPMKTAVGTYLYANLSSLVQNAVRGIPIGQSAGQQILVEVQPILEESIQTITQLTIEDFGAVIPGLEIAQMRHEKLHVRLFMS